MQPQFHSHMFCSFDAATPKNLLLKYEIYDYIAASPSKDLYFVSYRAPPLRSRGDNLDIDVALPRFKKDGVSVGIASSVTAYARIFMSQFKNNPDFNLSAPPKEASDDGFNIY